ncbi:hypothetical protein SDC9_206322 [bioreactor metagenome]|uniref:Uncharacterized protein n=1 Tax=bioreactor metagenome TaxID=1076179 RepID=A0A645J4I4_9ZZZZ
MEITGSRIPYSETTVSGAISIAWTGAKKDNAGAIIKKAMINFNELGIGLFCMRTFLMSI